MPVTGKRREDPEIGGPRVFRHLRYSKPGAAAGSLAVAPPRVWAPPPGYVRRRARG